jgi:hypothetical protein
MPWTFCKNWILHKLDFAQNWILHKTGFAQNWNFAQNWILHTLGGAGGFACHRPKGPCAGAGRTTSKIKPWQAQ